MQDYVIELLVCPICHRELEWDIAERNNDRIEQGVAYCRECSAVYPVQDGIGLFLTPDLVRDDLWEQVDSNLIQYLKQHPEVERKLMDTPAAKVAPADLFFRALALEERGDFEGAKETEKLASEGIYTSDYRACAQSQIDYVIEQLSRSGGIIVDIASGRGYLVEEMARNLERPIIATDFSPRVLRRDRQFLEHYRLYDQVSLLAFDARRTPFRDRSVKTLTTNQGLPNIEHPNELLSELRRIVSGSFLAISHFYPADDEANIKALQDFGLEPLLINRTAVSLFSSSGWQMEKENSCIGIAQPTPKGEILEGAGIDGLPVSETTLDWCVLNAR